MADTGWVIAGTGTNDTGVGTEAWASPGNVTADDASTASGAAAAKSEQMNYIKGSNFGLSVPGGATIDGIEIRGQFHDTGLIPVATRTHALVVHPTSGNGTDKETGSGALTATPTNYDYGGSSDLHGLSWTASDVNSSSFGVMFSCNAGTSGFNAGDAQCDAIWVKVHYTPASGGARSFGYVY